MLQRLKNLPWQGPRVLPWAILLCASVNMIFLGGKRRAFGTIVAELHKENGNISLAELNWIGDSYSALGYLSSSFSTAIILNFHRRYGLFQMVGALFVLVSCVTSSFVPNPHWLFLTHTVIHGIGSSLVISVVGLVVNEHFGKKHPYHLLATTLVSGGSVASIVFVTFFAYLIERFHWKMAFFILGLIYFAVLASGSIVFRRNDQLADLSDQRRASCSYRVIHRFQVPLLMMWFLERVITSVVTYGLLLNLTDYVHRIQPNLVRSTVLTTLFAGGEGLTYLIGAIITAATKDFFRNRLRYILLSSSVLMSATLVALEFSTHNVVSRRILCFLAGFSMGPSITFLFPAGEELTQLPGHLAYPFTLGGLGLGMIVSPLLTARIAERFQYKWFFLVQGTLIAVKVLLLLGMTLLLWHYKRSGLIKEFTGGDLLEVDEDFADEETMLLREKSEEDH